MEQKQKTNRGGARPGAGRPAAEGPTRTLTMRIPEADLLVLEAAGVTNLSQFYVQAGKRAMKRLKK